MNAQKFVRIAIVIAAVAAMVFVNRSASAQSSDWQTFYVDARGGDISYFYLMVKPGTEGRIVIRPDNVTVTPVNHLVHAKYYTATSEGRVSVIGEDILHTFAVSASEMKIGAYTATVFTSNPTVEEYGTGDILVPFAVNGVGAVHYQHPSGHVIFDDHDPHIQTVPFHTGNPLLKDLPFEIVWGLYSVKDEELKVLRQLNKQSLWEYFVPYQTVWVNKEMGLKDGQYYILLVKDQTVEGAWSFPIEETNVWDLWKVFTKNRLWGPIDTWQAPFAQTTVSFPWTEKWDKYHHFEPLWTSSIISDPTVSLKNDTRKGDAFELYELQGTGWFTVTGSFFLSHFSQVYAPFNSISLQAYRFKVNALNPVSLGGNWDYYLDAFSASGWCEINKDNFSDNVNSKITANVQDINKPCELIVIGKPHGNWADPYLEQIEVPPAIEQVKKPSIVVQPQISQEEDNGVIRIIPWLLNHWYIVVGVIIVIFFVARRRFKH